MDSELPRDLRLIAGDLGTHGTMRSLNLRIVGTKGDVIGSVAPRRTRWQLAAVTGALMQPRERMAARIMGTGSGWG